MHASRFLCCVRRPPGYTRKKYLEWFYHDWNVTTSCTVISFCIIEGKIRSRGWSGIHDFLWALMRLQIFDEGFRTAGSTIQQKHTVSHWSPLCLRVQRMKLLQIDSNESDTCQRVSLFNFFFFFFNSKSVKFAHSSMIGWTIHHFVNDVMSLSRNFSTWVPESISYMGARFWQLLKYIDKNSNVKWKLRDKKA